MTNTGLKTLFNLLLILVMIGSPISTVFSQQTLSSSCGSPKRMEIKTIGILGQGNKNITLSNDTKRVTIECTCRDVVPNVSICPSSIVFTIRKPNGTTQNISATRQNVTAIGYTGDMESSIYRAVYNGAANRVTYNAPSSSVRAGMRGLVVWEESEGRTPNIPNNYRVNRFLYGESMDHYINVPTSSSGLTRNFVISVPVHEHGSDGRHLVYHVRAFNGNSPTPFERNITITDDNDQNKSEIRLDRISLNNVPANVNRIRVYIESPGNYVGTSIIVGSILATSTPCCIPTLTCPSNITRSIGADRCDYTVQGGEINPTLSGGCPVTLTNNYNGNSTLAGARFPVGTTTITWTAGSATCQTTITVNNNQAPVLPNCPSNSQQTLTSNCGSLQKMDVHVRGIQNQGNKNITLDIGTNKVTMECVCRDVYNTGPCPNTVTWTIRKLDGTTQNVTATGFFVNVDDDYRFPSKMYRKTYAGTGNDRPNQVTYNAPSAASRPSMRGLVVWQESIGGIPNIPNNYVVDRFFYQTPCPQIYDICVPRATDPRDFVIRIPVHEHGNNGRPIEYQVRAYDGNAWSGVVNKTVTANNYQGEIRLDQITLNNINKDVYAIRVSIQSPDNYVGTSVVVGSIMVTSTPCMTVLPIELSGFKAIPEDVYNKILWTTDTELSTDYFELERRIQGGGWKLIERIDAAGYSESTKSYSCLDEFPAVENYYRLKSVDIDGSFEYSDVIHLDRKDLNIVLSNIYMDQISNNLIIRFNSDLSTEKASIILFDVNGRTIYKLIDSPLTESGEFMIDMNKYPAGVYFASVYVNDSRQTVKVIKQ